MNKLRLLPILIFGLLAVFVVSCKKRDENPTTGTGNTDLQVYVVNSSEAPIVGASVNLYTSLSDRDAGTNPANTSLTGAKGFAYFSELAPATYYVTVVKDYGSGVVKTDSGDTGVPIKEKEQSAITIVLE